MSMEGVRKAFQTAADGQARLTDAHLAYKEGGQVLMLMGFHSDGLPFAMTTEPFVGSPQIRAMDAARDIVKTHVGRPSPRPPATPQEPAPVQALRKQVTMGKLQQIAARAPQVVKDLEARADQLGTRLDALEKRGGATFDRWASHLSDQETAIGQAEDAINQLSNGAPGGPLPGS